MVCVYERKRDVKMEKVKRQKKKKNDEATGAPIMCVNVCVVYRAVGRIKISQILYGRTRDDE